MDDFQTTTKGGKQQAKKPFETPLPSVLDEQREQNKKKKKEANKFIYGASAATEEDAKVEEPKPAAKKVEEPVAAATGSGSDSEEDTKASGSKKHQLKMAQRNQNKKKGGKGGNRKKGGQQESDGEENEKEEEEEVKHEEKKVAKIGERLPIDMVYCRVCGIPPEYCMFDKKDFSECKQWVKTAHPELFQQIYNEPIEGAAVEGEEAKEESDQQQKKKKKKVSLAPSGDADIKVYKAKRGGKKMICTVQGLQHYGVPLKDIAKLMGKKFACGCAVADDDKYGECIQIQGDVEERFMDFVEQELAKYKVPVERVQFVEIKKKKKAQEGEDDGEEAE